MKIINSSEISCLIKTEVSALILFVTTSALISGTARGEDLDPTEKYIRSHENDPAVKEFAARAFGMRPARELYDLKKGPYELNNVAEDPAYAEVVKDLDAKLMAELTATNDPRASGKGDEFDNWAPQNNKPIGRQ